MASIQNSGEHEPLLGGPGDASQKDKPIYYNFALGIAQADSSSSFEQATKFSKAPQRWLKLGYGL